MNIDKFELDSEPFEKTLSLRLPSTAVLDERAASVLEEWNSPLVYAEYDKNKFYYDITGREPLRNQLSKVMTKHEAISLFASVADALLYGMEQGINPKFIVFDSDLAFVSQETGSIRFICVPAVNHGLQVKPLRSYIRELIVNMRYDDSENLDYLGKIINYLNREGRLNPGEFIDFVDMLDMQDSAAKKPEYVPEVQAEYAETDNDRIKAQAEDDYEPAIAPELVRSFEPAPEPEPVRSFEPAPEPEPVRSFEPVPEPEPVREFESAPYSEPVRAFEPVPPVNYEPAIEPVVEKRQEDFFAEPDFELPEIKLPQNKDKDLSLGFSFDEGPKEPSDALQPEIRFEDFFAEDRQKSQTQSIDERFSAPQPEITMPKPQPAAQRPQPDAITVQPFRQGSMQNPVQGFAQQPAKPVQMRPYMIRRKNGEKVVINKDEFKIGKIPGMADYLLSDNAAVSRMHAIIHKNEDGYYICDNYSTNATFLNGEKLVAGKQYILLNGVRISFANDEFTYYAD